MSTYNHILAKSRKNGGQTLIEHLQSVAKLAVKAARHAGLDERTAELGGLLHDIGKASPVFQRRLHGYKPAPGEMVFRHEIASLFFLKSIPVNYWDTIIDMIVAHHKSIVKDAGELGLLDLDEYYGDEVFTNYSKDFDSWSADATGILNECGIKTGSITIDDAYEGYQYAVNYCLKRPRGWSTWKGLLIGSDHFASALEEEYSNINGLFSTPNVSFYNREHQLYPLSLIPSDTSKKHSFVKAPTGAGKTDFLLKRCKGRIFYTLPFQASINAMYERICKDLKDNNDDIRLLHAASRLVIDTDHRNVTEEKAIQDKFGAAVKVLTPHQLASIAFGTKGYESILFDLKGCDIILDEIHTYSDVIQSVILKIVEVLVNVGCSIHIGTATISASLESAILALLPEESLQYISLPDSTLETFNRHIVYKGETFNSFFPQLEDAIKGNQKILLVCNRVKNAQSLFSRIEELYPDINKMLIHSRYKRSDRNILEKRLIEEFNQSSKACIVVSTQVVEVSLDISFDLMITETAPIDALIQRFGRINRKRNTATIGKYKPVCVIAPPEDKNECLPYSLEILIETFRVLPDKEVLDERTLQNLINTVYPKVTVLNIDLNAVFANQQWRIKELWHYPKSALLEKLNIESASCIIESDVPTYETADSKVKRMLEIPVSYKSITWKGLRMLNTGANPYIVTNECYSRERGLDLALLNTNNNNDIYL